MLGGWDLGVAYHECVVSVTHLVSVWVIPQEWPEIDQKSLQELEETFKKVSAHNATGAEGWLYLTALKAKLKSPYEKLCKFWGSKLS